MRSKPSNSTDKLYKLYHDFFIFQGGNSQLADKFASQMHQLFLTVGVHEITTIGMNYRDGIGDYVSQIYFIEKLTELCKFAPNVSMKHISLVSNQQLEIAKRVRSNKISENDVLEFNNPDFLQLNHDKTNLIGIPTSDQKLLVDKILDKSDFIFNLAIPLIVSNRTISLSEGSQYAPCSFGIHYESLQKNPMITSWCEYNFEGNKSTDRYYDGPMFSQFGMGLEANKKGIRFIDDIAVAMKKDKETLLNSLSKEKFKIPYNDKNIAQYIQDNSFATGYLQRKGASKGFVIMACQTSPKAGDMNMLVDISHFESILLDTAFIQAIIAAGFTHIVLPEGEFPLSNSEQKKPRSLRLFNFKGISNKDKMAFYVLSEMIAESGDTSLSELITAGLGNEALLPFFQPYLTGENPVIAMLEELPPKFEAMDETSLEPTTIYIEKTSDNRCFFYEIVSQNGDSLCEGVLKSSRDFPEDVARSSQSKDLLPPAILEIIQKKHANLNLDFNTPVRKMGEQKTPESLKMYIACIGNDLRYQIYDLRGHLKKGEVSRTELPIDFPKSTAEIIKSKDKYFPVLLDLLIKKGIIKEVDLVVNNPGVSTTYDELTDYLLSSREKIVTNQSFGNISLEGCDVEVNFSAKDIEIIKNNRKSICEQWRNFCNFLHKDRNEKNHFDALFVTYTFNHLLKNDCVDQCIEMVKLLNVGFLNMESLLHLAIKSGKFEAVKKIIEAKICDIDQPHSFNNYTPLHMAVHMNDSRVVKLLLENGANITCIDSNNLTAFNLAKTKKYQEVIKEFDAFNNPDLKAKSPEITQQTGESSQSITPTNIEPVIPVSAAPPLPARKARTMPTSHSFFGRETKRDNNLRIILRKTEKGLEQYSKNDHTHPESIMRCESLRALLKSGVNKYIKIIAVAALLNENIPAYKRGNRLVQHVKEQLGAAALTYLQTKAIPEAMKQAAIENFSQLQNIELAILEQAGKGIYSRDTMNDLDVLPSNFNMNDSGFMKKYF